MARGYLGKISAVISANNGSYVRALNDSAAKTRDFARTIQSDLKRASSDATKSINSILTPIQRLERALQNARSQRLSFRGFDGAVRNIKELQSLLSRIGDREIQVALNSAGLKRSVDEIKRAIGSISDADIDLFFNIVGRDGTLKDLQRLREEAERTDGKVVGVKVNVERSEADRLLGLFRELSPQRLRKFTLAVETQQLDKAELQMRRLFSVSERIARPLSAAAESYTKFGAAVQKALGPTLVEAQNGAERLTKAIENNASVSERRFRNVARAADVVTEAFARQTEAQSRAARIAETTRSLDFRAPGVAGALDRAGATAQAARSAPTFVRANPQAIENIQQLEAATERLVVLQARYEARIAAGQSASRVANQIREQIEVVDRLSQSYQNLALTVGQARFDEAASQARVTFAAYNALSSTIRIGLRDLSQAVEETLLAYEQTGVGADNARAAVERFSAAVAAGQGVDQINRSLANATSGGGFAAIARAAEETLVQFSRLADPLRTRLLPILQETIGQAVELGASLSAGANVGQRRVDALTTRVKALGETIKEVSELSPTALFRTPRDVRGPAQLNESVRTLDAQFSGLSTADRRSVQPLADSVTDALARLSNARIGNAPKREIQAIVVEYRNAVRDLEAFTKAILDTQGAFAAATPADRLSDRLGTLRARYDALGESASKASRELGQAARVAVAAASQPSASATDRTNARQALDVADASITRDERVSRVGQIFAAPQRDIDALLSEAEQVAEKLRQLPPELKKAGDALREPLRRAAKDAADTGQDTERNALKRTIDQTNATLESSPFRVRIEIPSDDLIKEAQALAKRLQAEFQGNISRLPEGSRPRRQIEAGLAALPPGSVPPEDLREQAEAAAKSFAQVGLAIDDPARRLEGLRSTLIGVKSQVSDLPAPLQNQFIPAIIRAEKEFQRLAASPAATAAEISRAAGSLRDLQAQAARVSSVESVPDARNSLLNIGAQESVGRLQAAQRLLLQVGAVAGGPTAQAFDELRAAQLRFTSEAIQNTPRARRELDRLESQVARLASQSGKISFNRALREIQRGGDIARSGFANSSLAIQQAVFAVDDFFSVTGRLDQRLRAAGNNISQLGFLLGGTAGLITGVAVSLGGQLVAALIRFAFETEKAEESTNALNAALDSQKSKVDQLAKSYQALADSIADTGLSDAGRDAAGFDRQLRANRDEERDAARDGIAARSPTIAGFRGEAARLREQLNNEENIVARGRLQRGIARAGRNEEAEFQRVEARAGVLQGQAQRNAGRNALEALRDELQKIERLLADADRRGDDRAVGRLTNESAALEAAVLRQGGDDFREAAAQARAFRQRVGVGQELLQQAGGFSGLPGRADDALRSLESALSQVAKGTLSAADFIVRFAAVGNNDFAPAFEAAAIAVSQFAASAERAATSVAKAAEADLEQAEQSLRRETNAAVGRFGEGDQRVLFLRQAQQDAAETRRQVAAGRARIESEVQRERQNFAANPPAEARQLTEQIAAQREIVRTSRDVNQRAAAQAQAEVLGRQLDDLIDSQPSIRGLRAQADQLDVDAQRRLSGIDTGRQEIDKSISDREELARRGRDLALSPGEREARDLSDNLEALRIEFGNRAVEGTGLIDQAGLAREQRRLVEESQRRIAPLAFQFSDEIANAVLQGPSRAALGATDASTTQGQAELNRLIRGDDPARDVNLLELQKQTDELRKLNEKLPFPVAEA